jgi:mRNA-degrading endonuclease RelE of RelBE toxin-antitoxin system
MKLTPPAEKDLRRLDPSDARTILAALRRLVDEYNESGRPILSKVTKLEGRDEAWRLKVGGLRTTFTKIAPPEKEDAVDETPSTWTISVLSIFHRGKGY